jgi:hypothetical protein
MHGMEMSQNSLPFLFSIPIHTTAESPVMSKHIYTYVGGRSEGIPEVAKGVATLPTHIE